MATINGTPGDDKLNGSWQDDDIDGDAGDDTLRGKSGNDSLSGGTGNDSLDGGSGADTLLGGDGDDELDGGSQDDLLQGGAGNDTLDGGSGADTIEGGDGDDLIEAASQDDVISGGDGNDTIEGESGDDLASGGDGDDLLEGASGADTLFGGAGNDTITGGSGDDVLTGGAGDDVIDAGGYGGGSDTIVFTVGDGNDTIDGFNPASDVIHVGGVALEDVILTATEDPQVWVLSFDGVEGTSLTLDFTHYWNEGLTVEDLIDNVVNIEAAPLPEDPYETPICLAADTRIRTARGQVAACALREGDMVATLDAGWQPVRLVLRHTVLAAEMPGNKALRPVTIPAGSFGNGLPRRTIRASRQHAFLATDLRDDSTEVTIRAAHLAEHLKIATLGPEAPAQGVTYVHLLLDAHHLIEAEGVWTETIFSGPMAMANDPVLRRLIAGRHLPEMTERARPLLLRRDLRAWDGYALGRATAHPDRKPRAA
ncbi:Alkaline phosphatase [Roseibacterium elongatum DSM 19469]|uniref:Alkaline phosphatase n=1 Tax=Roseicyclus elongatus DSM 19469 TaxID=1294273 RepID=W8S639_9RHOB|nr:Hint domain-containing protein [Roseibacterium elongatum]AHM04321.1 Alkaline phosphatase [Roseibacterium elongatum DSM 19469]